MKITLENLKEYGIGRDFSDELFPIDLESIVYGHDIEGVMTETNPEKMSGTVPYYKEIGNNRWWKVGPRKVEE